MTYPLMEERGPNNKKILFIVIAVVCALLVAAATYFLLSYQKGSRFAVPQERPVAGSPLGGVAYLTLVSEEKKTAGIYTFDFTTRTLSELVNAPGQHVITASVLGSTTLLLSSGGATSSTDQSSREMQIMQYDIETKVLSSRTTSTVVAKRHPIWVEKLGLLVYSAKSGQAMPDGYVPFSIYTSKDGVDKEIGLGAMPQLLPDGKSVLVLREEGLFALDLETGLAREIWGVASSTAQLDMAFDVSASGRYIAWTNPYEGKVLVMHVSSWESFSGGIIKEIPVYARWPVFSPDERSLVFHEFDSYADKTNPRLSVFRFDTDSVHHLLPLQGYVANNTFITDWK